MDDTVLTEGMTEVGVCVDDRTGQGPSNED